MNDEVTKIDGYILCNLQEGKAPTAIRITTQGDERRHSFRKTVQRIEGESDMSLWNRTLLVAARLNRRTQNDMHAPWMGGTMVLLYWELPWTPDDEWYCLEQALRYDAREAPTKRERAHCAKLLADWLVITA